MLIPRRLAQKKVKSYSMLIEFFHFLFLFAAYKLLTQVTFCREPEPQEIVQRGRCLLEWQSSKCSPVRSYQEISEFQLSVATDLLFT